MLSTGHSCLRGVGGGMKQGVGEVHRSLLAIVTSPKEQWRTARTEERLC